MTTLPQTLPAPRFNMPRPMARARMLVREQQELLFIVMHVPVALMLRALWGRAAPLHAVLVLGIGVLWALDRRTAHRAVHAATYIVGADVLWRMTGGAPIYEFAKYSLVLLLCLAMVSLRPRGRTNPLGLTFIVLLMPSILLTINALGLTTEARKEISFNLSGPIALGICVMFFSGCSVAKLDLRKVLVAFTAPIVAIATLAGSSTIQLAEHIRFSTQSNFMTSGGFGPNQVSAMLGLGTLMCVLLAFQSRGMMVRFGYLVLGVALITQAVLTFSRGGVLNAAVCIALLGVHFLRRPRLRATFFVTLTLVGLLGQSVILPALDSFTGGYLSKRYSSLDPSLRRELAMAELELWRESPALGVGPGMAKYERSDTFILKIAAHTEYTRLLAEHGTFGLAALLILVFLPIYAYLRAPTAMAKAWVAIMVAWSMLEMLHAAMRLAAIPFTYGLAMMMWSAPTRGRPSRPPLRSRHHP